MRMCTHHPYKRYSWLTLGILFLTLFAGCRGERPAPSVYRIGILCGVNFFADTQEGFKQQMTALGYVEGKNVIYDFQQTNVDPIAEKRILRQFVADEVDLILTFPTEVSLLAKEITRGTGIPVVFANANIEGVGLVDSIREPGEHITGVRYPGPDLAIKRFEIFLELLPEAEQVWLPYLQGYPIVVSQLDVLRSLTDSTGITLVEAPVAAPADLATDLNARAAQGDIGIDAILQIAEPIGVNPDAFTLFSAFAADHNIPVGGAMMTMGGYSTLFGVDTNNIAVGKQAATIADKILQGTPAGDIPVVSAESFFRINYNVAQKLGITVSEGLLSQADEIIR